MRPDKEFVGGIHLLVKGPDDLGVKVAPDVCLLPPLDLGHDWTPQSDLKTIVMEICHKKTVN